MPPVPPWFHAFCAPEADRLKVLVQTLAAAGQRPELVAAGGFRHLQVRGGRPPVPEAGERFLVAHYDRVAGSPGANDNGASVWSLVDYLRAPVRPGRLRVVFTDGEELGAGGRAEDQGSYHLARRWNLPEDAVPIVLDMTGIGDTPVLGHLGEQLLRQVRPGARPDELDAYGRSRLAARRWLAAAGAAPVEIDTPFSDDLGFFRAGVPSVQLSLLPRVQAARYRKTGAPPPAWAAMHTSADRVETLQPESRRLVAALLEKLETFPW